MRAGIYTEDNLVVRVEIIEDNSDESWLLYKLKIIEILQGHYLGEISPGLEFKVDAPKGINFPGCWKLREEEIY